MPIITVTSLPKPPVANDDRTTQSQLRQMDPKRKGCFGCTEALTLRDILQAINSEYVPPTVDLYLRKDGKRPNDHHGNADDSGMWKANCLEEGEEAVERLEQDQISPRGNRKDEPPVQGDSPQRDIEALKRRADDFNREKSSIIDEDIFASNSTSVEGRQSPFHSKRPRFDTEVSGPSNLMETASPAGQDQVQSSLEEIATRTTREEKVSCRLSGTPHCTVSSAVSQTSMDTNFSMKHTRRPDTPAGPTQGEQMAISDIKKENNDNQEELKQTKRKRDWTDEITGEESDTPPERPGKIGHRMREEDEKRIKELEEEVTCAWKFVFEYRTKWDKLTKALQHKDLAKVEREFPEIFRE